MPPLELFAVIFLLTGMAGVVAFTLLYGLRSKWYRYTEGRALMSKSTSLAFISAFVGSSLIFGEYPGREWIRLVLYFLFMVASWFFVLALVKAQRKTRRERDALVDEYYAAKAREASDPQPSLLPHEDTPVPVRIVKTPGAWRWWPFSRRS